MNPKRQKLNDPVDENLKSALLAMNDDCICKIFDWLELDDICSVSETCKKLKMLTSDYFQLKNKEKLSHGLRIVDRKLKYIEMEPNERYSMCFSQCFDTVIVNLVNAYAGVDLIKYNLAAYIRKHCSENLTSIQFQSTYLCDSFGDSISIILKSVETVTIEDCKLDGTYHQILKHCENLKYLTIGDDYGNKVQELLLEKYDKLEHFNCRYYGRLAIKDNLKIFLQQHPNLKRLTWCFHARIREATLIDKTLECIDIIMEYGKNLEELFLSFDGTYNLESVCDKLKRICDREHFKRLELDFRFTAAGETITTMMKVNCHQLPKLKSLLGLHLTDFIFYGNDFIPVLTTMNNLRCLQLDQVASIRHFNKTSLDGLSSLEQLHIGTVMNVQFVQKFVCEVKSLKIVSILRGAFTIRKLDLVMLNIKRGRLQAPNELVIHLDKLKQSVHLSNDNDLVKVEFVDFNLNRRRFKNPFVQR